MMKRFESDYLEGAHPDVLRALIETNGEQTPGYGEDPHCEAARALLRERCELPEGEVQFLVGGTQVNRTVIASILRPHQGVVAADTGHIAAHETGAIENSGHKVLTVPNTDGKIAAAQVEEALPRALRRRELSSTRCSRAWCTSRIPRSSAPCTRAASWKRSTPCAKRAISRSLSTARVSAPRSTARVCDYTLADMAHMCEVFTIGGTKMGLLFGEAAVFSAPELAKDFRYFIKQNGGMLAKGRLLGVQFYAAFKDGLYDRIGAEEVRLALRLRDGFRARGWTFLVESPSNQQFSHSAGRAHRASQAGVFVQPYAVFPPTA